MRILKILFSDMSGESLKFSEKFSLKILLGISLLTILMLNFISPDPLVVSFWPLSTF